MKNQSKETQVFRDGEFYGVLVENPTSEEWEEAVWTYLRPAQHVVVERLGEECVLVPRNDDLYEIVAPGEEYSAERAEDMAQLAE